MRPAALLQSGVATDVGLRRQNNEDRVYADDANGVFLVVDGLGGRPGGEKAAEIAVDVIARELTPVAERVEEQVRHAVAAANNEIFQRGQDDPELAGMACVLTLAVVHEEVVTVGHVGDSRLYVIWNGAARKATSDHSPVGEREEQGELTESEAMLHPRRNEVFRDAGSRRRDPDDADFVDVRSFPFHPAAALLLCTDGLSDVLTGAEIAALAESYDGDAAQVARALVDGANLRGGSDNVSVIFVPGREFIGVKSRSMSEARGRHAITRMRQRRARWKRIAARAVWVFIGMVLGMALWVLIERWIPHAPPPVSSTPVSWRE